MIELDLKAAVWPGRAQLGWLVISMAERPSRYLVSSTSACLQRSRQVFAEALVSRAVRLSVSAS